MLHETYLRIYIPALYKTHNYLFYYILNNHLIKIMLITYAELLYIFGAMCWGGHLVWAMIWDL